MIPLVHAYILDRCLNHGLPRSGSGRPWVANAAMHCRLIHAPAARDAADQSVALWIVVILCRAVAIGVEPVSLGTDTQRQQQQQLAN